MPTAAETAAEADRNDVRRSAGHERRSADRSRRADQLDTWLPRLSWREAGGRQFYERYASNLTRDLPKYSDAQIERVLRTGVPRDGRELWGMPSEIFQHLSAADLRALIADLRSTTPGGKPTQPSKPWEPDAKAMIAKGDLKTAKDTASQDKLIAPVDLGHRMRLAATSRASLVPNAMDRSSRELPVRSPASLRTWSSQEPTTGRSLRR